MIRSLSHIPLITIAMAFLVAQLASDAQENTQTSTKPILCQGNYQSEADAIRQLERLASSYSNVSQWKARADKIRKQILVGAGLYPLPQRTPLNSIVHNRRSFDGYTVESVAFEARPGYLVYGYQLIKRQAMYPFMVKHLGLDSSGVLDADGVFDESKNTIETTDQMRVFGASHPLPEYALKPGSSVQF